jgi:hypothetical protein
VSAPIDLDSVVIPSSCDAAGIPLRELAETSRGRHWLRWALRHRGWSDEFREALEEYARTRAPLVYRTWRRNLRGEA